MEQLQWEKMGQTITARKDNDSNGINKAIHSAMNADVEAKEKNALPISWNALPTPIASHRRAFYVNCCSLLLCFPFHEFECIMMDVTHSHLKCSVQKFDQHATHEVKRFRCDTLREKTAPQFMEMQKCIVFTFVK